MPVSSMNGAKYVIGITVISANGFKICYPCHSKSEMSSKLKFAKKYLENLTGEKIAEIVADKGGENMAKEIKDICLDAGIVLSKTGTEEHQSNGQIESWWRVALDCWRSHQIATNCSINLWADGLCYMAYVYNRLVHEGHSKTPYEALTNQIPSVHDLRVFGCLAYAYVLPKNREYGKLSPRGTPGIFIGLEYYDGHPIQEKGGYKVLTDLNDPKSVICSRDVIFLEDEFTLPSHGEGETISKSHHREEENDDEESVGFQDNLIVEIPVSGEDSNLIRELPTSGEQSSGEDEPDSYEDARSEPENDEIQQQSVHRLRSGKVWKNVLLTFPGPPLNVALNDPEWIEAMKKEDQQMKDMGVFELVEQPSGKQILNSLWVLVTKVDDETGQETKKARWVVDGSKQIQGDTYDKAFAATPSMASYKTLLAIRTERNMETLHIDWSGAYLNPFQDYEVHVRQPRGFEEPGKEKWVRKLVKACYGEKQAAYLWEVCRDTFLIEECGLERCPFDPCTFIKRSGSFLILCDVHADDAPFFYDKEMEKEMKWILDKLQTRFKIKVQNKLSQHLGMRVEYGTNWTSLDQEAYCNNVLQTFQENPQEKFNNPWSIDIDEEFDKDCDPSEDDKVYMRSRDYWGLVGKLQYLVNSRPDIAYSVSKLA